MKQFSLRTKILLSVGVIIFIVLGTSTLVHIQELKRDYFEALTWRSEALAQNIINEITDMQDLGLNNIEDMFPPLRLRCVRLYESNKDRNVSHFAVIDASGMIGPHNDSALWDTPVTSQFLFDSLQRRQQITILDGEIYHTLVPVFGEKHNYLATVDIGISKRVVDEKVQKLILQSIVLFVLFLLLAFFTVSFLMHVLITKPVRQLVLLGQQLAAGNLVQIPQKSGQGDEIAILSSAFSRISVYLQNLAEVASHIATGVLDGKVHIRSDQDILGTAVGEMLHYLKHVAEIATKVAEGDLTMMISLRSEHDAFGKALQQMMTYLREMAEVATTISTGDLREHITPRSDRDALGMAFQRMTAYLNRLATAATAIASGDLQQDVQPESEHDVLGNAFHTMAVQLRENFEKIQQEVAERTRAQEALQKLNEELEQRVEERTAELAREKYILETFMNTVPDKIYFKDLEGRITSANKAHAAAYGFNDPTEEIGKTDFDLLPEDLARMTCEQEQKIIRTGEPLLDREFPIPQPDGSVRWSLVTKMPLRDENGEIIGTFGISRDITSQKQARASLEQAYSEILSLNRQLQDDTLRYYMKALLLGAPSVTSTAGIRSTVRETWNAPYFCVVLLKLLSLSGVPTSHRQTGRLRANRPLATGTASEISQHPTRETLNHLMQLYEEYSRKIPLSGVFSHIVDTEAALILNLNEYPQARELCAFITSQSESLLQEYGYTLVIGIGDTVTTPEDLHVSYDSAQQAIFARSNTSEVQILSSADAEQQKKESLMFYFPVEKEQQLITAVIAGQYTLVQEFLQDIVDQNSLEQSSYQKLMAVYNHFLQTAGKILAQAPIQDTGTSESPLLQTFRAAKPETIQELRERLGDVFRQLLTFYSRQHKQQIDVLTRKFFRYLERHYADPSLSLDSIAEAFKLNPSYLSRYFKEQTGMNYVDYLAMLRIKNAKNLLVGHPRQKIHEIGIQVGFSGKETFIRTFKRFEGVTPGTYRKRSLSHAEV
jgi:PAS domain S-box-containing protein